MTTTITDTFKLAVAQLNPTVGDIAGNVELARKARAEAATMGADLVLFSELFIAGYPPEDLILKPAFMDACQSAVHELANEHGRRWTRPVDRRSLARRRQPLQRRLPARRGQGGHHPLQGRPAQLRRLR